MCVSEERSVCLCCLGPGACMWSHLGADGSGVGVKIRRTTLPGLPQQGTADGGGRQRHRQRPVLIVCGHVGDTFPTIAHLISGTDVEG